MSDLLLNLPQELLASILCDWLGDSAEICRLESAYCNRELKPELLQVIAAVYIVPSVATGSDEEILSWLITRSIKTNSIVVRPGQIVDSNFMDKLFRHFGPNVKSIAVERVVENSYTDFLGTAAFDIHPSIWQGIYEFCPNVRELDYSFGAVDPTLMIVLETCRLLTHVNFEESRDISTAMLQCCCELPHLETLNLTRAVFADPATDLAIPTPALAMRTLLAEWCNLPNQTTLHMLINFPNLVVLSVALSPGLHLLTVAKHTPNLQRCELMCVFDVIDAPTAAVLCVHWQFMQILWMYHPRHFVSTCSEEGLLVLVQQMPTLQNLRVIDSVMQRGKYAPILPPSSAGKSKLIDLQAAWMSAATLEAIVKTCPYLVTAHLFDTSKVHQAPLYVLHNTSVKTVVLERAVLSDEQLMMIRDMKEVFLVDTRGDYTVQGLISMAKQCPQLSAFVISHVPAQIDHLALRLILDACPNLTVFVLTSAESRHGGTPTHLALEDIIRHFYPKITSLHLLL